MFDSREFEFADTKIEILGKLLKGLRGYTIKEEIAKDLVYAGRHAVAIQRGEIKYSGTLILLKSDFDALQKIAIEAGYTSILHVPFMYLNITCTYTKEDRPAVPQVGSVLGLEFTDYEDGMKQGDKFKEVTLPFLALKYIPGV